MACARAPPLRAPPLRASALRASALLTDPRGPEPGRREPGRHKPSASTARTWHCILPLIEITTRSTRPLVAERRRALTDLAGAGPAERLSPTPHKRKEQSCQRPTFTPPYSATMAPLHWPVLSPPLTVWRRLSEHVDPGRTIDGPAVLELDKIVNNINIFVP